MNEQTLFHQAMSSHASRPSGPGVIKKEGPPKPSTRLSDSGEAQAAISAQRYMEPAKLVTLVLDQARYCPANT